MPCRPDATSDYEVPDANTQSCGAWVASGARIHWDMGSTNLLTGMPNSASAEQACIELSWVAAKVVPDGWT